MLAVIDRTTCEARGFVTTHPFRDVAIVAAFNTRQARVLEGHTPFSITLEAARGVLAESQVPASNVDAVFSKHAPDLIYALGIGPVWNSNTKGGIAGVLLGGRFGSHRPGENGAAGRRRSRGVHPTHRDRTVDTTVK